MTLKELKTQYYNNESSQIKEYLFEKDNNILSLNGVKGSSLSFIASQVASGDGHPHLFVFRDSEEAAFFMHDLEVLMDDEKNHWLKKGCSIFLLPSKKKQ